MSTKALLLLVCLALAVWLLKERGAMIELRGTARELERAASDVDRITRRRLRIHLTRRQIHGDRYYGIVRLAYARNN